MLGEQQQVGAVELNEQADADFAAGFDEPGADAPVTTDPVEGSAQEAKDQPKAAEETAPVVVEPVLINGIPEADWNAAVAKAATPLIEQARAEIRKNFGQIGEVNKALKEIRDSIAAGGSSASRKKLTSEALKRVNEELPGLGDALALDLAEFFDAPNLAAEAAQAKASAEASGNTFDPEAFFSTRVGPALSAIEARANERAQLSIVKALHRDFDQVVVSPEFVSWLGTLPAEEQQRIRDSEEGFVAAAAVTDFKSYRSAQDQARAKNQRRLSGALTPQGDRRPGSHIEVDDDAALEAGFKS